MTTSLRAADPYRNLVVDPNSERAQALYRQIVAQDRAVLEAPTSASVRARRLVAAVAAAGAVAAALVVVATRPSSPQQDVALGPAGYRIVRQSNGAVQIEVKWSEVSDPHAMQLAIEAAGARV